MVAATAKKDDEPGYVRLHRSGELKRRVEEGLLHLENCRCCPWNCEVNRLADEYEICRTGRYARVSSYFPHYGEEDCLRGWRGSGTIFFAWCNLRCVFCQNYDISHPHHVRMEGVEPGHEVKPERLAQIMLELQDIGCHNINWVTPEHVVPQILEALPGAIERGLRLPIVYNTSAYDALDSLKLLDGIVDIYMPDFKYWSPEKSKRYLKCPDYAEHACSAIKEMHRQVGDLTIDATGLARRGVLVRHLVMPGEIEETRKIMQFLAEEVSSHVYVNIMDQYYPAGIVSSHPEKYPELTRRVTPEEMRSALRSAQQAGLYRFDQRKQASQFLLRNEQFNPSSS